MNADEAKAQAEKAFERVKEIVEAALKRGQEITNDLIDKAKEYTNKSKDQAGDTADKAKDMADGRDGQGEGHGRGCDGQSEGRRCRRHRQSVGCCRRGSEQGVGCCRRGSEQGEGHCRRRDREGVGSRRLGSSQSREGQGALNQLAAPLSAPLRPASFRMRHRRLVIGAAVVAAIGLALAGYNAAFAIAGLFVVAVPFEKLWPRHRQRLRRPELTTDLLYAMLAPITQVVGAVAAVAIGLVSLALGSRAPAPADRRFASESGAGSRRHRPVRLPRLREPPRIARGALPLAVPLGAPLDEDPRLGVRVPGPSARRRVRGPGVRRAPRRRVLAPDRRRARGGAGRARHHALTST